MLPRLGKPALGMLAIAAALSAAPALADVKAGVDAWSRGDYAAAVREWEGPAAEGDADAMFNLGQAYRLGRGVPVDRSRAEALYAQAAARGHLQAADTYGLMLFQDGRREDALPYIQDAARRGDPRAQYLVGIAHFNGDLLDRDWERAYAFMTLANSASLPQARGAIAQMDAHIPLTMRQSAVGLAVEMRREAEATRARELATAELAMGNAPAIVQRSPAEASPQPSSRQVRASQPTPQAVDPSELPAVSYTPSAPRSADEVVPVMSLPEAESQTAPSLPPSTTSARSTQMAMAAPVAEEPAAPQPAPPPPTSGEWKVQLGAFSVPGNAERLWASLASRPELSGKERLLRPTGRVTRLLAGGYASQSAANAACNSLKSSGQDCLVTR